MRDIKFVSIILIMAVVTLVSMWVYVELEETREIPEVSSSSTVEESLFDDSSIIEEREVSRAGGWMWPSRVLVAIIVVVFSYYIGSGEKKKTAKVRSNSSKVIVEGRR